jgi:hypothetical protein
VAARAKAIAPLALIIGVLSFAWCEFSLNFQFHWVTDGDIGNVGLSIPGHFQLVVWIAFISWGLFFAAGGDNAAFGKILIAAVFGTLAALATFAVAPRIKGLPDFYGISIMVGVFALILVLVLVLGDWYYVAGTFPCFAAAFAWWVSTGLDNWAPNGGGVGGGVARLTSPLTAGAGAFSGVLSTPFPWVFLDTLATLVCGLILGIISTKIASVLTPRPKPASPRAA